MSDSYANGVELSESDSAVRERSSVCPVCNNEYKNVQGMSTHHTRSHNGSVYLVRECAECDGLIAKGLSDYNDDNKNHFCSDECESKWRSETLVGENHPRWGGGMDVVECSVCGSEFERRPSYVEKHDNITCSKSCYSELLSEMTGSKNNNWKGDKHSTETCLNCSKRFTYRSYRGERLYCSRGCAYEHRTGKHAANWKGGWVNDDYGANWKEQRQKALERDGHKCVMCGLSATEAKDETNSPLHVHHRKRKEEFRNDDGSLNYEVANRLSNLITLCVQCHGMWEEIAIQPVVE